MLQNQKRKSAEELLNEPEYIILDEECKVFAGCRKGYPYFSDNMDDAKPLQGQEKFKFLQRRMLLKLEQMFLDKPEYVRKKRKHRKSRVSI